MIMYGLVNARLSETMELRLLGLSRVRFRHALPRVAMRRGSPRLKKSLALTNLRMFYLFLITSVLLTKSPLCDTMVGRPFAFGRKICDKEGYPYGSTKSKRTHFSNAEKLPTAPRPRALYQRDCLQVQP